VERIKVELKPKAPPGEKGGRLCTANSGKGSKVTNINVNRMRKVGDGRLEYQLLREQRGVGGMQDEKKDSSRVPKGIQNGEG